jgi:hypothetical protein
MADGTQMTTFGSGEPADADALQQQPDHALGDLEVGDGPTAQRAHGHDVAGGAPDHLPSLAAGGQHLTGLAVEGDDGGLVEHDALALHVHQRVGGAEVDGEVAGHQPSPAVQTLVQPWPAQVQHEAGQHQDHRGGDADDQHEPPTSCAGTGAVAPVPQASPPSQRSCFQIGAEALTRVDQPTAGGKRLGAVRGADRHDDRALRQRHLTGAVRDGHLGKRRPADPGLGLDRCQYVKRPGLVGLVGQRAHTVTPCLTVN